MAARSLNHFLSIMSEKAAPSDAALSAQAGKLKKAQTNDKSKPVTKAEGDKNAEKVVTGKK